jgi:hypothetical protein
MVRQLAYRCIPNVHSSQTSRFLGTKVAGEETGHVNVIIQRLTSMGRCHEVNSRCLSRHCGFSAT